jgi:hypothetical protein
MYFKQVDEDNLEHVETDTIEANRQDEERITKQFQPSK